MSGAIVETGNVLQMRPANGSEIIEQIEKKMSLMPFWPWALVAGGVLSAVTFAQPNGQALAAFVLLMMVTLSVFLAFYDRRRKTVVIMYDLDEDAVVPFRKLVEEFETLRAAMRIWNIKSAEYTDDTKRNAGANRLVTRQPARLVYNAPRVVKTNVTIPAILGGRQNIYFFPDVALIVQGFTRGCLVLRSA
jgi:hypothetical protein